MSTFLFTSESVSEGHPDKLTDRISDTVLDAFLARDPYAPIYAATSVYGHFGREGEGFPWEEVAR